MIDFCLSLSLSLLSLSSIRILAHSLFTSLSPWQQKELLSISTPNYLPSLGILDTALPAVPKHLYKMLYLQTLFTFYKYVFQYCVCIVLSFVKVQWQDKLLESEFQKQQQ